MFIKTFKKNYPLQLLLLTIIPLVMWASALANPPELNKSIFDMPFYNLLYSFTKDYRLFATITSFVLIFLQAIALNYLFSENHLCQKNTFLPAFIYIILMSCSRESMTFSSILFANMMIIIALHFFFKCHDKKEGIDEIFNASFFLALATLFYVPSAFFMLWMWGGFVVYKLYKWRSWVMSLFGYLTPFMLIVIYYYLMNKNIITSLFSNVEEWIQIDFSFLNTPIQVVYISALLLYTIPAIFKTASSRSNRIIEYRKKSGVLLVMFFIAIIPFFLSKTQANMSFVFAIPLSFLLCNLFLENPKEKYTNMFLLIFILLSIFKVYFQM